MATYNKFLDFTEQLIAGNHDFDAHSFKIALTDTLPVNTQTVLDTVTNHPAPAAANGYAPTATNIAVSESGGTTTVTGTEVIFTATAGGIGPFRYAILYNDTSSDYLIAWWDYGSSITLAAGESFTVKFNNASPGEIFDLT